MVMHKFTAKQHKNVSVGEIKQNFTHEERKVPG